MPTFQCTVCSAPFDVPLTTLEKYPGWSPKYCRTHSPKKKAKKPSFRQRSQSSSKGSAEENLTTAQVLERYTDGPTSGVFTDGSSIPNPGPGGWGAVWVEDGDVRERRHGFEDATTNNRMELQALIEAYRLLPEDAAEGWTKKGGEIKNLERVKELLGLYRAHPNCRLEWIAAHSGNRWNEYADSLSTAWKRSEV